MIEFATEICHVADGIVALHGSSRIEQAEVPLVVACRNHVLDVITDLYAHAAGPFSEERKVRGLEGLAAAPTAFLARSLRAHPRLPADDAPAPSEMPAAQLTTRAAREWRFTARHATLAAAAALRAPDVPLAMPGEKSQAISDLAALAEAFLRLDRPLAQALESFGDPRAGAMRAASQSGLEVACREVRREHLSAPLASSWQEVVLEGRPTTPIVVRSLAEVPAGLRRLDALLIHTRGQLDVRAMSTILTAQTRAHQILNQAMLTAADRGGDRRPLLLAVARHHSEVAQRLEDVYRKRHEVASPLPGDYRAAQQAGEVYRALRSEEPRLHLITAERVDRLIDVSSASASPVASTHWSLVEAVSSSRLLVVNRESDVAGLHWKRVNPEHTSVELLGRSAAARAGAQRLSHASATLVAVPARPPRLAAALGERLGLRG